MLGRIVLPIEIIKDGRIIQVRNIDDLKENFNSSNYFNLAKSLENKKLKQFFYGNGFDDLAELIQKMTDDNAEPIDILNAIAKELGVPPLEKIDEIDPKDVFIHSNDEISRYLSSLCTNIILEDLQFLWEKINLIIYNDKKIYPLSDRTSIQISNIEFRLNSDTELIIENINFSSIENTPSVFVVKGGKLILNNCNFEGIDFVKEDGTIEVTNCTFSKAHNNFQLIKVKNSLIQNTNFFNNNQCPSNETINSQIFLSEAQCTFENTNIYDSEYGGIQLINSDVIFNNSSLWANKKYGFDIKSSKLKSYNIKVYQNGSNNENYSQINISNYSEVYLNNSSIHNSNANGIYCENSSLQCSEVKVYENYYHAFYFHNSKFILDKIEVYKNGNKNLRFPQIWIDENSEGTLKNSSIFQSINANGITCENSSLQCSEVKVYENFYNGLIFSNSKFILDKIEVYKNGNKNQSYSQIWIGENSEGTLKNSSIFQSINADGISCLNSSLQCSEVKVYKNFHTGLIFSNSKFILDKIEVYKNGNKNQSYSQIGIVENSEGALKNSSIFQSINAVGIYCKNSSLQCSEVKVYENYYSGLAFSNSKFFLEKIEVYKNGNNNDNNEIGSQIWIVGNSEGALNNSSIYQSINAAGIYCKNSSLQCSEVKVYENYYDGLIFSNSKFILENIEVYKNGNYNDNNEIGSQIWIDENSEGALNNSSIYQSINAAGIYCKNSSLQCSEVKVYENYYDGLIFSNSKFILENIEVYKNGNDNDKYPQIWIYENSEGALNNSSIYQSINAAGISCLNSSLQCSEVKVYENYYDGLIFSNSKFILDKIEVYKNGNDDDDYSQILIVENSEGALKNSSIYQSINAGGIYCTNSSLQCSDVKVYENFYNGLIFSNSKFILDKIEVYKNGNDDDDYSQIWIDENSEGALKNSSIFQSINAAGISCLNSSLQCSDVKVYENYYNGLAFSNSKFFLEKIEVYKNGNDDDDYSQILIGENSEGALNNSSIYQSINADGIYCENSSLQCSEVKIYKNYYKGLDFHNSKFILENIEVYKNGNNNEIGSQIGIVENSEGALNNSSIYQSINAAGISCLNSSLQCSDVKVYENYYSGLAFSNSKFILDKIEVYKNGNKNEIYPQIWIDENSEGQIINSNIYNGINADGINVENSKIRLSKIKTKNNLNGLVIQSSIVEKAYCNFQDGFKNITDSSSGGCFITTAVMHTLGKEDDCEELSLFRYYRDNYLLSQPYGEELVREYYTVAPAILAKIQQSGHFEQEMLYLWNNFLQKCYTNILNKKFDYVLHIYSDMIVYLKNKYL